MYTCIPYGLIGKILSSLKYCLWLAICQISIYMIGFPGDSIQRNLPQKLYHILTPIVMRLSLPLKIWTNISISRYWKFSQTFLTASFCMLLRLQVIRYSQVLVQSTVVNSRLSHRYIPTFACLGNFVSFWISQIKTCIKISVSMIPTFTNIFSIRKF